MRKYIFISTSKSMNNFTKYKLTTGKVYVDNRIIYDYDSEDCNTLLIIKNDDGKLIFLKKSLFKSLYEWRIEQLNSIGI